MHLSELLYVAFTLGRIIESIFNEFVHQNNAKIQLNFAKNFYLKMFVDLYSLKEREMGS